ncbi:SGNH/GDSL hydrolase family protein [Nonomuraea sp. NBC_01738]|uniref:SGNH/GDSL hydrolase family protein n=1 Tax=Nonomuraea sp. NBC_01738 TaxID=2976003 RepID=UPI002E0F8C27|nr:SGNH/GDSL hydrolase family protein [Nonomuraea sp. NBC_01738]
MFRRLVIAVSALALTLTAAPAVHASAGVYVALGDSAASGPLIPNQILPQLGCFRSDRNYAHLSARDLGASLRDVTCSGADIDDMYQPQKTDLGTVPAQLDAVGPDATLVTVQIGANDLGLTDFIQDCLSLLPGDPCNDEYQENGQDTWRTGTDALRPRLDQLVRDIRQRAPAARVFIVGYATYAPVNGCWPRVPILKADANYIRATLGYFNQMLAEQAAASGVGYVDLQTPSEGHDPCRSSSTRWIEPYVPANAATPFHPNANGMRGFSVAVTNTVRSPLL